MKYHPIQFNGNIDYKETLPLLELSHVIVCYWEIKTNEKELNYAIIPDACVDIIVNCSDVHQLFISPISTQLEIFNLSKKETWFGVRFYPGLISNLLRTNLSTLQFETLELGVVNGSIDKQIKEVLKRATSFEERTQTMNRFFLSKELRSSTILSEVIDLIYQTKGAILLKDKHKEFISMSERHLRRLFKEQVGIPPKKLASIVRNQSLLKELQQNKASKFYYDLYYDQSHMIREVKKMTGLTPNEIILNLNK